MGIAYNKPRFLTEAIIPDGEYTGGWSGYELEFEYDGKTVIQTTKRGVRGVNIPVSFRYKGGSWLSRV